MLLLALDANKLSCCFSVIARYVRICENSKWRNLHWWEALWMMFKLREKVVVPIKCNVMAVLFFVLHIQHRGIDFYSTYFRFFRPKIRLFVRALSLLSFPSACFKKWMPCQPLAPSTADSSTGANLALLQSANKPDNFSLSSIWHEFWYGKRCHQFG